MSCPCQAKQCDTCACAARYTTVAGKRSCALCCMGRLAVRDIDLPTLLARVGELLTELDKQGVSAGAELRGKIRYLVGVTDDPQRQ